MKVKSYNIKAIPIVPFESMDHEDQINIGEEGYDVIIGATCEAIALDTFHNNFPISCLEDFEISVEKV